MRKLRHQQQQHQAGPSSPHSVASTVTTPRTPKPLLSSGADVSSAEFVTAEGASRQAAPTPDRLQPHSVPATPEMLEFGGDPTVLEEGRAAWHSPPPSGHVQQQMLVPDALSSLHAQHERSPASSSKLTGLPSAEDIDALCDMDKPSHRVQGLPENQHRHDERLYQPMHPGLAPVLTHSSGATHDDLADRPLKSGVPNSYTTDASTPQHSSSHFKQCSRQQFPPNRSEMPESSVPCSHSFRLHSECDSSAYDEGASSTLIHSISNEEQSMHDLLGDDNDDIYYNVMDTRQHDSDMAVDRHRTQQLNTMELHGLLGQHGYKLPELAGEQVEDEESDGDDIGGDGDEDLDDPDGDDDDVDEDANKAVFKVGVRPLHLPSSSAQHSKPVFCQHSGTPYKALQNSLISSIAVNLLYATRECLQASKCIVTVIVIHMTMHCGSC